MKNGLIISWLLSITAAFFVGYHFKTIKQPIVMSSEPDVTLEGQSVNQEVIAIAQKKTREVGGLANELTLKTDLPQNKISSIVQELQFLLGNNLSGIDMPSISNAYQLIKNLSEAEVIEALYLLEGDFNKTQISMPLNLLLSRFAEINPEEALLFVDNNLLSTQGRMSSTLSILTTWSKSDPEGAYIWHQQSRLSENNGGMYDTRNMGLFSIFNGLANNNLPDAIDKLKILASQGEDIQMAGMAVTRSLNSLAEYIDFIDQTKSLENDQLLNTIVSSWAAKNPDETLLWLDTVEGEKEQLSEIVLNSWMNNAPKKAADWYINQSNEKQKATNRIVQSWGARNPKATLNWLNQQEGIDQQKSLERLLSSTMYSNTNFAIDNLNSLSDDVRKKRLSTSIYVSLKRNNKKKANEFLNNSSYKEHILKSEIRMNRYKRE